MRSTKVTAVAALALAATLGLTACGGSGPAKASAVSGAPQQKNPEAATVLDPPFQKPDLVLTDTHGKPFDLRARTHDKPTLIYFGYTHCPDICPLTMSNLAIARKSLPAAERNELQVVFITTDPERDTPAQLAKWLPAAGDASFIGLTGDFKKIQAGAKSLGIGIDPPVKEKNGTIVSTHGAEVIAFSPRTNGGYLLYGDNTSSNQYAKDLPAILKGAKP